ncbi:MAG: glycosyltransferase family 2 protein, partial [Snowella sp.]
MKTPVVLIIFRRPDKTLQILEKIRQVKPSKLFVICDAPRPEKPDECEKCEKSRAIIDTIDWDCEVIKNYAETNLGPSRRIPSGLDWVFGQVEEAIILEDDCLPDVTFFRFCEELL